jgi:hypothetical protein
MYTRHKDVLSESFGLLKNIWDTDITWRPVIASLLIFSVAEVDDESQLQMILSPTTLNIRRPPVAESLLRKMVTDFLTTPGRMNNLQLKEFFSLINPIAQSTAAQNLLKIRPIHLTLLHALFEYSHVGQIAKTVNRFNKISSVVQYAQTNRTDNATGSYATQVYRLASNCTRDAHTLQLLMSKKKFQIKVNISSL